MGTRDPFMHEDNRLLLKLDSHLIERVENTKAASLLAASMSNFLHKKVKKRVPENFNEMTTAATKKLVEGLEYRARSHTRDRPRDSSFA